MSNMPKFLTYTTKFLAYAGLAASLVLIVTVTGHA
jgi:hypothetical protein